jgi:hypothetical protein
MAFTWAVFQPPSLSVVVGCGLYLPVPNPCCPPTLSHPLQPFPLLPLTPPPPPLEVPEGRWLVMSLDVLTSSQWVPIEHGVSEYEFEKKGSPVLSSLSILWRDFADVGPLVFSLGTGLARFKFSGMAEKRSEA